MSSLNDKREEYLSTFNTFEEHLAQRKSSPLQKLRREAIAKFGERGFPRPDDEEWRFTPIAPLLRPTFKPAKEGERSSLAEHLLEEELIRHLAGNRMVFLNGWYSEALSQRPPAAWNGALTTLANGLEHQPEAILRELHRYAGGDLNPFTALNTGFLTDGVSFFLPDDTTLVEPLYIIYLSLGEKEPLMVQPRNLIVTGRRCRLSIIEHSISAGDHPLLVNGVTEIVAGEGSRIEQTILETEGPKTFHLHSTYIHQRGGSNVTSTSVLIGGALVRNNITATLDAEETECTLNGISLATGQQLIDNHTLIDHAKPRCSSREFFKAVLDGESRGIFNGKIYVRKDAQQTDSKQTNKTLLLSEGATMNTKPQLEIFADDVKCTHGATVGYIDADSIFYLRSRGIGEEEARDILTTAFARDMTDRISIEAIREHCHDLLFRTLARGRAEEATG